MKSNLEYKDTKVCIVCKRSFNNRKKWKIRNIWEQIIYCSDTCRRNKKL
jgi:hypothetical protein